MIILEIHREKKKAVLDNKFKLCFNLNMKAIIRAIKLIGSQTALANYLGVKPQAVNQWAHGGRPIPPERVIPIEQATKGQVTRHEL